MQEGRPRGTRSWIRSAVVFPLVAAAAGFLAELVGVAASPVLAVAVLIWIVGTVRCVRRRSSVVPRTAGLLLVAALVLLLRATPPGATPPDLAELLLRDLLAGRHGTTLFFIEIDGRDPPPGFLRRFADLDVRLEPRSAARILPYDEIVYLDEEERERRRSRNVHDAASGEAGTLLRIGDLATEPGYLFSLGVDAGAYSGTLAAWGRRHLVMHLGRWRITGGTMLWVS